MSDLGGRYTVGYWKIRGLAAPIRMALQFCGADYIDEAYERFPDEPEHPNTTFKTSSWDPAYPALKEQHPMMNLPYLKLPDGRYIVQSNSILRLLGRQFDLYGRSEIERSNVDQVLEEYMDFRTRAVAFFYRLYDPEKLDHYKADTMLRYYTAFENFLAKIAKGASFSGGSDPTVADFAVFEMVDQHELLLPGTVAAFPRLSAHRSWIHGLPELAPYFSGAGKWPCNNKHAKWGAK